MQIDLDEVERRLDRYPDNIYANVKIEIKRFGLAYAPKITFTAYISRGVKEGRASEAFYTLEQALGFIEEMYERYHREI